MSDWKPPALRDRELLIDQPAGHVSADIPKPLLRLAEALQRSRIARAQHFDAALFGEPGWDMLLAVYVAHGRGYRLNVTDVCFESRVPQTTALRWLNQIEQSGLVERRKRVFDGRSAVVGLTTQGLERVSHYLEHLREILSQDRSD